MGEVFAQFAFFYPSKDPELLDQRQIRVYLSQLAPLVKLIRPAIG